MKTLLFGSIIDQFPTNIEFEDFLRLKVGRYILGAYGYIQLYVLNNSIKSIAYIGGFTKGYTPKTVARGPMYMMGGLFC
jgi:hypothetical protein